MTQPLVIPLNTAPELANQLTELQRTFADVCNAIVPVARETRCWNRVALHHLLYRSLRERFPQMGSQMVCNAIYSVSRTCRLLFQSPGSPFNLTRLGDRPLPQLQFAPSAPVYFDRHTLSIRNGVVSMYTLDGRIRFRLSISAEDEQRFQRERLREIVLSAESGQHRLSFLFGAREDESGAVADAALPEYVTLLDQGSANTNASMGEAA